MDLDMTSYYDLILGLIPLVMTGVSAAFLAVGAGLAMAVSLSSVAALGLIGHAMFVHGPTDDGGPTDDAGQAATTASDAGYGAAD